MIKRRLLHLISIISLMSLTPLVAQQAYAADCTTITQAPNLYQIDRVGTESTLYFTPVNVQTTGYTIVYGTTPDEEQNSVDLTYGDSTGAISYVIGDLDAGSHYFYRVRANNDCSNGPYSQWVEETGASEAVGGAASPSGSTKPPVTGPNPLLNPLFFSIAAIGLGVLIIFRGNKRYL